MLPHTSAWDGNQGCTPAYLPTQQCLCLKEHRLKPAAAGTAVALADTLGKLQDSGDQSLQLLVAALLLEPTLLAADLH